LVFYQQTKQVNLIQSKHYVMNNNSINTKIA
jgi:hypothetical protein